MSIGFRPVNAHSGHLRSWRPNRALSASAAAVALLLLKIVLLIKGSFMDVFSAIIVMVPLIQPIAAQYGIDPVPLGVIFLANLELGNLTPPIGMNLCLSAYRFK